MLAKLNWAAMLAALLLSVGGYARGDEGDKPEKGDKFARGAEMREKMIAEFDADGDGELNKDERAAAREKMMEMRRQGGQGRPEGRPEGRPQRGPGAEGDRPRPPSPEALFKEFDADGDNMLSKAEFMKLSERMRQMMPPPGGPRGPGGPPRDGERGPRGPRPDGPPRDRPAPE